MSCFRWVCLIFASVNIVSASFSADAKPMFTPGVGPAPFAVKFDVIGLQGTGCPAGGAVATLSPDGSSVSILFDKMSTELPASPQIVKDRKQCMVQLGVQFSGQYRIAIVGSDARGFVSVPSGGTSTVSVQHYSIFTMDRKILARMNLSQTFNGPVSQDILLHSDFHDVPMWSYCGTQMGTGRARFPMMSIVLTIDSSNANPAENLVSTLDSLDIGAPATLTYNLLWTRDTRSCPH